MKMNYFVFGTNNMQKATKFYDAIFEGSEVKKMHDEGRMTLWGSEDFMFALAEPFDENDATVGNGTMVGISLGSVSEVERLHKKALELGGSDEGEPRVRSGKHSAYVGI